MKGLCGLHHTSGYGLQENLKDFGLKSSFRLVYLDLYTGSLTKPSHWSQCLYANIH